MTKTKAVLTAILVALPLAAAAELIPETAPTRTNPEGTVHVQYLVGPQATVGKQVAVNRLSFTRGAVVPEHIHAESDEILVVTAGQGLLTLDGKTIPLKTGDTVFIPRGHKHAFTAGAFASEMIQVYEPAGPEARFKDWKVYHPVTR